MGRGWAMMALLASVWAAGPASASLQDALDAARKDQWDAAASAARQQGGAAVLAIEWMRLRDPDSHAAFPDYQDFLKAHSDWPGLPLLRKSGELAIDARTPPGDVIAYFSHARPQTPNGAYWLSVALRGSGQARLADETLIRAWTSLSFDDNAQALWQSRFAAILKPYNEQRMNMVLWNGRLAEAERMMPLVGAGWQRLAQARLGLRLDRPGIDGLVAAVPGNLADDPGLAYERMAWRMDRGRYDDAADLMLQMSKSAKSLGDPEAWADRRSRLARQEMRDGKYQIAYRLAASSQLQPQAGEDYADLEWLAGYVALHYLGKPDTALVHFRHMGGAVSSPISLGRAGYWEGRALEAMGQAQAAHAAYARGAQYQTSYYGQLAAERGHIAPDRDLSGTEDFPEGDNARFRDSSVYQAAIAFYGADDLPDAARFFAHLAESMDRTTAGTMVQRLESLKTPYFGLTVAKRVAVRGISLNRAYFPLMPISTAHAPDVPPELALAIARRESEFNPEVISRAGARGLMQLMPGTAQLMARRLGISYDLGRLTSDPRYNTDLGTAYLQEMSETFGANVALVAAAYNAGPNNVKTWIARYGDPRDPKVDAVDWVESIPFTETRNYVMRVTEALAPYRARLAGKTGPIRLAEAIGAASGPAATGRAAPVELADDTMARPEARAAGLAQVVADSDFADAEETMVRPEPRSQ